MEMVIDIGSLSEAWRLLTKVVAETQVAAYDREKREFESIEIGVSKPVAKYFARVHVILMKLTRHLVTTPAREIKRGVLSGLTPRFTDEVRLYAMRSDFDLSDLGAGIARAESFQSDQDRRNPSAHALAVAHATGGRTGAGGGRPSRQTLNQAPRRWLRSQPATGSSATDAPRAATAPTASSTTAAPMAAAAAGRSLGQLGETTSPTAVPAPSASPAETTTSGRRSVVLAPAAHVPTLRREGALPRRVQGNSKPTRTSAVALPVFGTISRSPCHAVRLLPPSSMDIARIQR